MKQSDPAFFVRYAHLPGGTFYEDYLEKELLPFLFRGEKEGYLQVFYFKQIGGRRYEVPGRNQKAQAQNGYEETAKKETGKHGKPRQAARAPHRHNERAL